MIRYIYGDALTAYPKLAHGMFKDRADQFKTRLNWDVAVDAEGLEKDAYDAANPLYVIWETPQGAHGGSMRLLPTTGPTMLNDHFSHIIDGTHIASPLIWECTRFCLARGASSRTAAGLMLAGGEIMQGFGVEHFAGVFDARMVRIYNAIGANPEILGTQGSGRDQISIGLWAFSDAQRAQVAMRAGVSETASRYWFMRAFGDDPALLRQTG